jgi:hypothetical protein
VASRKEQKEQLRREREEREATARAAARRKRLVGYAAGAAVVILALAVAGFVLLSGDDDEGGGTASADVLPDGGEVPAQEVTDLGEAASAASCEQKSSKADSREHISDIGETVEYSSDPPTSGRHFESPEQDGAFEEAPDTKLLMHTLEHGRVIIWFKPTLPEQERANLKALFDEDEYQMVLVPSDTMPYEVAATAWNREPEPNGTGRLLGCDTYSDMVFDALRAFKDEHRSNGPEAVP